MARLGDHEVVAGLGWSELTERDWDEALAGGLPHQLIDLIRDASRHLARPIRLYTMPMMEVGVAGLALPFVDDDGIVLDPVILGDPALLPRIAARELARMFHPGWSELRPEQDHEVEEFVAVLAPMLLWRLPSTV